MKDSERLVQGDLHEPVSFFWREVERRSEFTGASTVLMYMSIPGEVPTYEIVQRWSKECSIVLPLVSGQELLLKRYEPEKLVRGYRGIMEPSYDAPDVDASAIDLAIVPGVAFCRSNGKVKRLGRGGGFYDRLLPALNCFKLGVCFDFRVVDDLPCDPWDAVLDDLAVCRL